MSVMSFQSSLKSEWMTVFGPGDVTWTAVFDSVQNRFAFYDRLDPEIKTDSDTAWQQTTRPNQYRNVQGPLSYVVVGWYADREKDPLWMDAEGKESHWNQRLKDLGWCIDIDEVKEVVKKFEQYINENGVDDAQQQASIDKGLTMKNGIKFPSWTSRQHADTKVKTGDKKELDRKDKEAHDLKKRSFESFTYHEAPVSLWWPRQILCHGSVIGVPWGGSGDPVWLTTPTSVPELTNMEVAVGNGQIEALGALLTAAMSVEDPNLEIPLLEAFHYGIISQMEQPDGVYHLKGKLHELSFSSHMGGYYIDSVRNLGKTGSNPLMGLNGLNLGPAGVFDPQKVPNPTELMKKLDSVHAMSSKDSTFRRVRRPGPRYYEPVDPVVAIRGPNRSLRHGYDGRFEPEGTLRCRVSGSVVKEIHSNGHCVPGAIMHQGWIEHGGIVLEARELVEETLLLDPCSAPTLASQMPGVVSESLGLEQMSWWVLHTDAKLLNTFTPDEIKEIRKVDSVDSPFDDTLLPSPLALQPWRHPWVPLLLEWEVAYHPSPDGMRDWRIGEIDYELQGFSLFRLGDIKDWQSFLSKLIRDKNADQPSPGKTLWTLLPPETQALVENLASVTSIQEEDKSNIISALNVILNQRDFVSNVIRDQKDYFPSIDFFETLPSKVKKILDKHQSLTRQGKELSTNEVQRLNRLLIEAAYPNEIAEIPRIAAMFRGRSLLTPGAEEGLTGQVERFLQDEDVRDLTNTGYLEENREQQLVDLVRTLKMMDVLVAPLENINKKLLKMENALPVRAGFLSIQRLRVVDAFGQIVELALNGEMLTPTPLRIHNTLVAVPESSLIAMRPRLHVPARLMFRLLKPEGETEATNKDSPICGYLLPDLLDFAGEVCDAAGNTLGQLDSC